MIGVKLARCELEHSGKQCRSKGDAARFAAATFVGLQFRMGLRSVRANGRCQVRRGDVPQESLFFLIFRVYRTVEQPSQDHPISHVEEGTPTGETYR